MRTALVTGSAGFVGRHMAAELSCRGWGVVRSDIADGRDSLARFARPESGAPMRFDLVIHAAAVSPHRAGIDTQPAAMTRNQLLDAAMFDWAIRTRQGRVLYLSSCAAADPNLDDYGWIKLTGERMADQARRAGIPVTVVRPYSGYGSDQSEDFPFRAFVERARRREDPFTIWGDGQQVRDWIHIDDVVQGALALVEAGVGGPVDLCTGIGTSMTDLVHLICKQAGYSPDIEYRLDKPGGSPYRVGNPTQLLKYYTPTVTLEEGVRRAFA